MSNLLYSTLFTVFGFTLILQTGLSKIIEGEINTNENWLFLTRFCFLSRSGRFTYEILYPYEYKVQNLLLYYDSPRQWPAVYKTSKRCDEKEEVLSVANGQVINLTSDYRFSNCHLEEIYQDDSNTTLRYFNCSHFRVFQSARERWWFIAISNCQSNQGLKMKYRLTMTNDDSNPLLRHFSADQFYILHTDVIFTVLYFVLLIGSFFEAYALYTRHLFHITYKLYLASLVFQCLSLTLLTIYYVIYADHGYSYELIKLIGKMLEAISTLVFLLLLILLAKGYTITRARLKVQTFSKIGVFMALYTVTYATIFLYEQLYFDPGQVLYLYESWPGYGIILLRILGWFWFVYSIVFTLIHYPSKSAFLTKLFLLYSIWFISAPVVILISSFVVPKWMREKIINAVELFIAIHAHLVFFILTRPSKANKNFPFHVRTTQIDVMAKSGEAGDETLDKFTHYPYAPSRQNFTMKDTNRAIFSVSSQNMFNGESNGNNLNPANNVILFSSTGTLSGLYSTDFVNDNGQVNGYTSLPAVDSTGSS